MQHIAFDYGVSKSTICKSIQWIEKTLIKSGKFKLPSKRNLLNKDSIGGVIIYVTECEIESSKTNRKNITQEKRSIIH